MYKKFNHLSLVAKWFNKRWRSCKKALFIIDDCNRQTSDQCYNIVVANQRFIFTKILDENLYCVYCNPHHPRSGLRTILDCLDWCNVGLLVTRSGDGLLSGQTRLVEMKKMWPKHHKWHCQQVWEKYKY